jgi:hypothetical protein
MTDDPWLAGFTDGEGCFLLVWKRGREKDGPRYVNAVFQLTLRADDRPVLAALQTAFGGRLHDAPAGRIGSPSARWMVTHRADRERLIAYFDRFPLRSKKARDYARWREAHGIIVASGGRDPRLLGLRESLMAGRAFPMTAIGRSSAA